MSARITICILGLALVRAGRAALADPLPGEILKFQQAPMVKTLIGDPAAGTAVDYYGHDEISTAFLQPNGFYRGPFMADDFADKFSTPVVHVRWWGSYQQDQTFNHVNRFLVAFEDDIPEGPGNPFSRPGGKLLSEIVDRGPLAPGSGTFTEKVIRGPDPLIGESLYEYNAELACPFPENRDTVYWLKIVALVDPQTEGPIQWGWHNRDYTVFDPFASSPPLVMPGERNEGPLPSGESIWHFQDDAVSGDIFIPPGFLKCDVPLDQANYRPENYHDLLDGPAPIIGTKSKDLAFELYTVPEPSTISLAAVA